jgi:hypothetical protein
MFDSQKNYSIVKTFFFIFIVTICFYRSPYIFINGRFVAEEGSFFFRNSYIDGPIIGLFQVYLESSYFNLWANISSVFASLVPLQIAPLVTVYMAFFVKLLLFFYILFPKSTFFQNNYQRYIILLIVIFSPPMVIAEIWLNTLVSQIYFTLIVFFIFFIENEKKVLNYLSVFLLLVATLSSVLSCIFTIFFFVKIIEKRNKKNIAEFSALFFGSCVQCVIFFYTHLNNIVGQGANERYLVSFHKLISFFYNAIVTSFLGRDLTQFFYFSYTNEKIYVYMYILFSFFLVIIYFLFKNIKIIVNDKIFLIIFFIFLLQSLIAFFGGKGDTVSGRFVSIPGVLLIFLIFRIYIITIDFSKKIYLFLIVISMITGAYSFKQNNKYPQFFMCINCPDWKNEIAKWQKDKNYNMKIWQYPTKTMNLSSIAKN